MTDIQKKLFEMQNLKYKNFHKTLIPTVDENVIIGVSAPVLRQFAKELYKHNQYENFLNELPHKYYEENNLHGFLIEQIKDWDTCISEIDKFLPYVDNWATCDSMRPKVFKKHFQKLLLKIREWIQSDNTYTIRFGIEMLMCYYLDDNFNENYLEMVSQIKSQEYYVNMMIAWFFSTALAKQYNKTLPYIQNKVLPAWVHNKTIQKSVESYRITSEQKTYLKTLKIK